MTGLRELCGRRPFAVALLAALALLLVPYRTLLGPGVPSGRDLIPYFYPLKTHLVEALRAGEMPWVDRYRQGGLPLLSSPGVAAFDPGNVLFLLLPTALAAKAWMLLRVLTGAAGFAVFLRAAGFGPFSSAFGGLAWGASGITASAASFLGFSSAYAALPWFAAALLRVRARRDARSVAFLALATALLVVASVPEPLLAAVFLAAVLLSKAGDGPPLGERLRTTGLWAAAGLLGGLLAAPVLGAFVVTAADSIRSVPGALTPGFAAQGALPPSRLVDLVADGVVADWTAVSQAEGVAGYPYFPSLNPGRVAWTLALLGLVAGRGGRVAAASLALLGVLLALGPATPVGRLFSGSVPFAASLRYPEKWAVLFGFGVVWLAAIGASALERALSPRRAAAVFSVVLLLVVVDRAALTARLVPVGPSSLLEKPPDVLAPLAHRGGDQPPPRVFSRADYRGPSLSAPSPAESGALNAAGVYPWSATRFGVGFVFERDYDASLPLAQLDWIVFLEESPPSSPVPAALARYAGAVAEAEPVLDPAGHLTASVRKVPDPVPPFRLVRRVVPCGDRREAASRFLRQGAPVDAAFVVGDGPGFEPSPGRVLRVADRPSGLEVELAVDGPGPASLLVCRPFVATRDARLDGRPAKVREAAPGFAEVGVPPGRHVVRLRPPVGWVIIAAVLSALAAAVTAVLFRAGRPGKASAR